MCCIKRENDENPEPRNLWKKIFGGHYYQLLMKKGCQWTIIGIAILLSGLAVTGLFFVPVGLNQQVSMELDSDLFNYFTYEKKYIEVGPPAYIVLNNFNYTNPKHISKLNDLNN